MQASLGKFTGILLLLLSVLLLINYKSTHPEPGVVHHTPEEYFTEEPGHGVGSYMPAAPATDAAAGNAAGSTGKSSGSMNRELKGFDPKIH